MRANDKTCSVEIVNEHVGFFAQMTWCLAIFHYCEQHDLIPDIRLTSSIYLDPRRGSNWLDHYFVQRRFLSSSEAKRQVYYTKVAKEWEDMGHFGSHLSLDDGARLFYRYLCFKPHIAQIVEDFWERLPSGPVLGIHFRGTDKSLEASRVSWTHCIDVLNGQLQKRRDISAVFAASDEQEFIDFIAKSVSDVPVYWRTDHYRSFDGQPVHLTGRLTGSYEKGEDALVNAILLSKCSVLLRTSSFLSAWASILNPGLKVVLLNKPFSGSLWYPESEIVRRLDTEYVPEPKV